MSVDVCWFVVEVADAHTAVARCVLVCDDRHFLWILCLAQVTIYTTLQFFYANQTWKVVGCVNASAV